MMIVMSESSPATFPVTTALGLEGMTVERDLGLTFGLVVRSMGCLLYTSPSPRDGLLSRMPSSA